jgi:hypothetical protein
MNMELPPWDALRCGECEQVFARKLGSIPRCSRCGKSGEEGITIVGTAENPQELQLVIATANVPQKLRRELAGKLPKKKPNSQSEVDDKSPERTLNAIRESADEEGQIERHNLLKTIARNRISATPEQITEWAEAEGMLLRVGEGCWRLIE